MSTQLTPYGPNSHECGYCGSKAATSHSYGMEAPSMTSQYYQNLIDRGWRRSGDYVYHPDMGRTCCPQYTIRLDSNAFKPTKKQRQVINRFNRFLSTGFKPGEDRRSLQAGSVEASSSTNREGPRSGMMKGRRKPEGSKEKGKGKGKVQPGRDFVSELRAHEIGHGELGSHRFETQLVPAKATKETFELYKRYQIAVHKDEPKKVTMKGFERFLCTSPLVHAPIEYNPGGKDERLPSSYGSYHLLYRIDSQLIGISVIDILPSCVSSVYFIWDPDWAWASLGKWSAMREIALARDIRQAGAEGMNWVYMGFWIPNCVKMRYKSEYSPSYLLDPGTNTFHPLTSQLDMYLQAHPTGYHPFDSATTYATTPESTGKETGRAPQADRIGVADREIDGIVASDSDSEDEDETLVRPSVGFADPSTIKDEDIDKLLILLSGPRKRVMRMKDIPFLHPEAIKSSLRGLISAVGMERLVTKAEELQEKGLVVF